ncbi:ImpA family metalloprotease [Vibrio mediterranei]|uniref:ImpA family metalloprotease n=1 Tax=Vibrio mediterranei TaxID=689 RepID=UPI00148D9A39|nr:ImpA family metalloprotease [Vibrio mediterranei]NOI26480.1 hypothetical protein [Vibrio mediterranei]
MATNITNPVDFTHITSSIRTIDTAKFVPNGASVKLSPHISYKTPPSSVTSSVSDTHHGLSLVRIPQYYWEEIGAVYDPVYYSTDYPVTYGAFQFSDTISAPAWKIEVSDHPSGLGLSAGLALWIDTEGYYDIYEVMDPNHFPTKPKSIVHVTSEMVAQRKSIFVDPIALDHSFNETRRGELYYVVVPHLLGRKNLPSIDRTFFNRHDVIPGNNNSRHVRLSGNATPGFSITITTVGAAQETYSTVVDANGRWVYELPLRSKATRIRIQENYNTIMGDALDVELLFDYAIPVNPTASLSATSIIPEVSGTAEASSTIKIAVGGDIIGTTKTQSDKTWTTRLPNLPKHQHIQHLDIISVNKFGSEARIQLPVNLLLNSFYGYLKVPLNGNIHIPNICANPTYKIEDQHVATAQNNTIIGAKVGLTSLTVTDPATKKSYVFYIEVVDVNKLETQALDYLERLSYDDYDFLFIKTYIQNTLKRGSVYDLASVSSTSSSVYSHTADEFPLFNADFKKIEKLRNYLAAEQRKLTHYRDLDEVFKILIQLGDMYRANIDYTKSSINDDHTSFMKALFADHTVYMLRENNAITDFGYGYLEQKTIHTTSHCNITLHQEMNSYSTGICIPASQKVKITRTDTNQNVASVDVQVGVGLANVKCFDDNEYTRAKYIKSERFTLKAGESVSISSPYGGILILYGESANISSAVTLEVDKSVDYAVLDYRDNKTPDASTFPKILDDYKTPYCEVLFDDIELHLRSSKMRGMLQHTTIDAFVSSVKQQFRNLNEIEMKPVNSLLETHDKVATFAKNHLHWIMHNVKPIKVHFVLDITSAGGASYIKLIKSIEAGFSSYTDSGWGTNHELGHSRQISNLGIETDAGGDNSLYYASGEVSNNIFPAYIQSCHVLTHGLDNVGCNYGIPYHTNEKGLYSILTQSALHTNSVDTRMKQAMWSDRSLYGNNHLRLTFYVQIAYTAYHILSPSLELDNPWRIFSFLYMADTDIKYALEQDNANNGYWDSVKSNYGFENFSADQMRNEVTYQNFMVIILSYLTKRNWTGFFFMYGVDIKDKVVAAVNYMDLADIPLKYFIEPYFGLMMKNKISSLPLITLDSFKKSVFDIIDFDLPDVSQSSRLTNKKITLNGNVVDSTIWDTAKISRGNNNSITFGGTYGAIEEIVLYQQIFHGVMIGHTPYSITNSYFEERSYYDSSIPVKLQNIQYHSYTVPVFVTEPAAVQTSSNFGMHPMVVISLEPNVTGSWHLCEFNPLDGKIKRLDTLNVHLPYNEITLHPFNYQVDFRKKNYLVILPDEHADDIIYKESLQSFSVALSANVIPIDDIGTAYAELPKPSHSVLSKITWSSSNDSIVQVYANGNYHALTSGTVEITATDTDTGVQSKAQLTVRDGEPHSPTITDIRKVVLLNSKLTANHFTGNSDHLISGGIAYLYLIDKDNKLLTPSDYYSSIVDIDMYKPFTTHSDDTNHCIEITFLSHGHHKMSLITTKDKSAHFVIGGFAVSS